MMRILSGIILSLAIVGIVAGSLCLSGLNQACVCSDDRNFPDAWFEEAKGKLFQDYSAKLSKRFGDPIDTTLKALDGFRLAYFWGPDFTKKEAIGFIADYDKKYQQLREWVAREGKSQGLDKYWYFSSKNPAWFQLDYKVEELGQKFQTIYQERIGDQVITFKDLADSYKLKNPELSTDESYKQLFELLNIDESYQYKYKSQIFTYEKYKGVKGEKLGFTDGSAYNYYDGYMEVYVDTDGIVMDMEEPLRKTDGEDLQNAELKIQSNGLIALILVVIGYSTGRYYSSKTECVVISGWKDLIYLVLTSVSLAILTYRFFEPTPNILWNDPFLYLSIAFFVPSMSASFKFNNNPLYLIISLLTKLSLLLLLPLLAAIILVALGAGKKDGRYRDGTKGNTRTLALGIAGVVVMLVLGSLMKEPATTE